MPYMIAVSLEMSDEPNLSVSNFIKGIDEISESYIKKKNVYKLLREIVDSFYQNEDLLGKVE